MDLGIKGRVAVVTGAASKQGIGRAIALALAREGANVAVTDIVFEELQLVATEIKGMGRKAMALKVDQGIYDEVKQAVAKIGQELGPIDILVNNAAITSNLGNVSKMPVAAWEKEINVNLNGAYYWTREVLPSMAQRKWGRIVNMSSLAAILGFLGQPSYAASKGGLVAFTKTVAQETAKNGVTANAVSLGMINTRIYQTGQFRTEVVEGLQRRLPIGRMAEPSEVADLVVFLASDRARYITGANIVFDGGVSLSIM